MVQVTWPPAFAASVAAIRWWAGVYGAEDSDAYPICATGTIEDRMCPHSCTALFFPCPDTGCLLFLS